MPDQMSIEEVNQLIEQHSGEAKEAISHLKTVCQQDDRARTPLNIAIQSNNHEITCLLARHEDAINFSPSIDENLLVRSKYTIAGMFDGENVAEAETYLSKSFGSRICFQRTPLHVACRYSNNEAIELLISRNAPLNAKDILGLTPFELCIQLGEESAVRQFISSCAERNRKVSVSELTLKKVCRDTALYQKLIQTHTLDINAKRFAFNLACALLDRETMGTWLKQGLKINKTMNDNYSPILEICTSSMLSLYDHPEAPVLAGTYAEANSAGNGGIHIDNDAILNAETPEELEALFSNSIAEQSKTKSKQTSLVLSDGERRSQLERRVSLIDWLVEHGLDTGIAEEKAPYGFLGDIVNTDSPALLQALVNNRFALKPEKGEKDTEIFMAMTNGKFAMVDPLLQLGHQWGKLKKSHPDLVQAYSDWKKRNADDIVELDLSLHQRPRTAKSKRVKAVRKSKWTWELFGESMLLGATVPGKVVHDKPVVVRLTHNNVYGPVDSVQLFVRIGDPSKPTTFDDLQRGTEWQTMSLVEELLFVDDEFVDRSSITETIYGETSWEATYECTLTFPPDKRSIEIKVVSDIEEMNCVITDWVVTVK